MIRIAGTNIPDEKCIEISLTYIYGIGRSISQKVLEELGIDPTIRAKDILKVDADRLRDLIEKNHRIEGELRHERKMNIRRLKEIGCYRGLRHQAGLPTRGQKTKTNSRTVRGNKRVTAGSGRANAASKT
ncbi:MAG: 30S ribosomal protein S13 [Candidatus Moranbacteria bacterium]|nr:30S ribosomal protein S13 [Candidatus Moranbacteria bacterium]